MRTTNLIKRCISSLLCLTMFIGVMPINIVFANAQKHVTLTSIKAGVDKTHPAYSISLEWRNPTWSTNSLDPDQHKPEGFRITERNATQNGKAEVIEVLTDSDITSIKIDRTPLTSGSIYEYSVVPYHIHQSINANGTITTQEAPYDSSTTQETALLMTDIEVEAVGSGNTLTVTFDNPKYENQNIFTGYRIYYQEGGAGVGSNSFNSVVEVSIDNTDLVASKDKDRNVERLTYQITNQNIKPGVIFAVKVEPMYQGKEVRQEDYANVMVNGVSKKITFTPKRIKEYRIDDAYVSIPLYVTEDGKDYLKLTWSSLSGLTTFNSIEKIEVLSGESENDINQLIGTIYGPTDVNNINTWRINKPINKTYYKLRIKLQNIDTPVESSIAVYDPSIVNITPNQPTIYPKNNVRNNTSVIDLYWDTFTRPAYNESEESLVDSTGLLLDTNIVYDVWVADSLDTLEKLGIPKILDKVSATDITTTNIEDTSNKVFYTLITEYVTVDDKGNFETKDIQENKTYYIKIVATKPTSDGLGLSSEAANAQIYIPARGDISNPKSLSRPPLRIKQDDEGNDMITQTSITIQWNTKWFEVYDSKTDLWYSKAAIRDGVIIFDMEDIKETDIIVDFYDKNSEEDVKLAFLNAGYENSTSLSVRQVDLSSSEIQYEMIVELFDDINSEGGYQQYIEELLSSDSEKWQSISPTFDSVKYAEYELKGLTENTAYAILLRPYKILSDGKKEAYPTHILATTLPKDTTIEVTPVVPSIYEVSKTDTSILVEWVETVRGMGYELAISEKLLNDPSNAEMFIETDIIQEDSYLVVNANNDEFRQYDILNLFPDTGYYIWVRAKVLDDNSKVSDWSTPIYVKTNTIEKPEPPTGLGIASNKNVTTYNNSNNTDYVPKTENYIVLEWNRDAKDLFGLETSNTNDNVEALIDEDITLTYLAKFNDLLANKYYYARAKTKVTVVKGTDYSLKLYSYIVQLSINEDFKDAMEIEIPYLDPSNYTVVTAESDWTTTYRFKTEFSTDDSGDYDGNIIDDLYPLPTEDFEIIYDTASQTLTYRFRSNSKDSNGNNDNLVDQRFITNLINNKVFNYNIDLTNYNGNTIKARKVELPYSIISAFEQRKISLSITAGGTRVTLNPGFLDTSEVKNLSTLNSSTLVSIQMTENPSTLPIIELGQTYTTTPQNISIGVTNNNIYKELTFTGSDMDISLKLKSRSFTLENNVGAYRNISNSLWERIPSTYSSETGIHTVKTNRLGNYTTLSNSVKVSNGSQDLTYLTNVNSKILFTDLNTVDMNSAISVVQFNNIVAGIANNKKEFTVNTALSTEDTKSLTRAGMIVNGAVVSKEEGVNVLIKLYEMKTKAKYEPIYTVATTPYTDIKSANTSYQSNLVKAGELGFFGDSSTVNPKDVLTVQEMLYMVDIILSDCGY